MCVFSLDVKYVKILYNSLKILYEYYFITLFCTSDLQFVNNNNLICVTDDVTRHHIPQHAISK